MKVFKWVILYPKGLRRSHLAADCGEHYGTLLAGPHENPHFPWLVEMRWINYNKKFNKKGSDYESCS